MKTGVGQRAIHADAQRHAPHVEAHLPSAEDNPLGERDMALWLQALQSQPSTEQDSLLEWVGGPLRAFYPFERCLLIHAQQILGQASITHLLQLGHDPAYIQQLPCRRLAGSFGESGWNN